MEELKLLIEMLTNLPTLSVWVLAGYLVYRLAVIGSIYGLIHFSVGRLFDWLATRKVDYKDIRPMIDGICVRAQTDRLVAQLHRIRGKGVSIPSEYIHEASVDWLREAIDDKIEKDLKK